ncbi:hypothetical protein [Alkalihalobacterium elongatum]|uniref:hypothetical protein n=1 Tax=Alkalihalobacterium elongatum TaxID=2675466 RepID=UPI001C1F7D4B|nr:hypothetical protein [Alkalihalobacterium elongatum]
MRKALCKVLIFTVLMVPTSTAAKSDILKQDDSTSNAYEAIITPQTFPFEH